MPLARNCSQTLAIHRLQTLLLGMQGWHSMYYFCGPEFQYCTCTMRWSWSGWVKAAVIWNFVLSSALGLQKLAIQLGLNGMLPGEEVRPLTRGFALHAFEIRQGRCWVGCCSATHQHGDEQDVPCSAGATCC